MKSSNLYPSFAPNDLVEGNAAQLSLLAYLADTNLSLVNRKKNKANFIQAEFYDEDAFYCFVPSLGLVASRCGTNFDRRHFVLPLNKIPIKKIITEWSKHFDKCYFAFVKCLFNLNTDTNLVKMIDHHTKVVLDIEQGEHYRFFENPENLAQFFLYQCIIEKNSSHYGENQSNKNIKQYVDSLRRMYNQGTAKDCPLKTSLKNYVNGMSTVEIKPALLNPDKNDPENPDKVSGTARDIFDTNPLLYTSLPYNISDDAQEQLLTLLTKSFPEQANQNLRLSWILAMDNRAPKNGYDISVIYDKATDDEYAEFQLAFTKRKINNIPFFIALHQRLQGVARDFYLVKYREDNTQYSSNALYLLNYDISTINLDTLYNDYFKETRKGELYLYKISLQADPNHCSVTPIK